MATSLAVLIPSLLSYGHSQSPQLVVWGLALAVVLIAAEYARRSSSNR
jgi:hypothetical protein